MAKDKEGVAEPIAPVTVSNAAAVAADRNAHTRAINGPVDMSEEDRIVNSDDLRELFIDGVTDVVNTSRDIAAIYVDSMLPRVARQIVRRKSSDPAIAASAAEHLQHLRATAIGVAAQEGIGLEQRQETRMLTVLDMIVNAGLRLIK